jgi:hypothetical protein
MVDRELREAATGLVTGIAQVNLPSAGVNMEARGRSEEAVVREDEHNGE